MSKEVLSNRENASTGYHIGKLTKNDTPELPTCEEMQKCYPPFDLKRLGIGLLGVAVLFVVAAFVLS